MPKRTNPFQRLIHRIESLLHEHTDATVTESKELLDLVTGETREVDIVIEATVGPRQVVIGIECTDKRRRANVGWVDEMYGKLRDLPLDQRILVSASGFSKNAIQRARRRGLQTLSLEQAVAVDWARFLKTIMVGQRKLSHVGAVITMARPDELTEDLLRENPYFMNSDGERTERFFDRATRILRSRELSERASEENWGDDEQHLVELLEDDERWLVDTRGAKHRVVSVKLKVLSELKIAAFHMDQRQYGDRVVVSYASTNAPFGDADLVLVEEQGGPIKASIIVSQRGKVEERRVRERPNSESPPE